MIVETLFWEFTRLISISCDMEPIIIFHRLLWKTIKPKGPHTDCGLESYVNCLALEKRLVSRSHLTEKLKVILPLKAVKSMCQLNSECNLPCLIHWWAGAFMCPELTLSAAQVFWCTYLLAPPWNSHPGSGRLSSGSI